jgi:hypothetical protein
MLVWQLRARLGTVLARISGGVDGWWWRIKSPRRSWKN